MPERPVLQVDNGATLKATAVLAMLHWLGIKPSFSRPRVSDDNAFADALFRTGKYRPEFRSRGSPICTPPGNGRCASSSGTTTNIAIAASATSLRRSVMPDRMAACSPLATWSTKTRARATGNVGAGRPATGNQSAPSPSIRSATSSSGRQPHKSCFPVRSANLLSRPDLATPRPRRAPDLLRSEHRGTLSTSRRFASPEHQRRNPTRSSTECCYLIGKRVTRWSSGRCDPPHIAQARQSVYGTLDAHMVR
jgi:hypothetical protein